ncbi:MAG: hypothetical protein ACTSVI_04220 [Promethearchaeota archaeon]
MHRVNDFNKSWPREKINWQSFQDLSFSRLKLKLMNSQEGEMKNREISRLQDCQETKIKEKVK